jgi:hypothetical protein
VAQNPALAIPYVSDVMTEKRLPFVLAFAGMILLSLLDGLAFGVAYFFAGWRYVLSPRYREAKAKEWHTMRQTEVMAEIVGGVTGVVVSVLLAVFVWWGMRNGA